jgi:hypothetical protein
MVQFAHEHHQIDDLEKKFSDLGNPVAQALPQGEGMSN